MGRAIYYCVQCSKRVSDSDLDSGKAFRIGERILCKACAPAGSKTQTTKKTATVSRPKNSGTSVALKNVTAPLAAPPPGNPKKKLVVVAAAAAAIVLLLGIAVLLSRKGPPPGVAEAPKEETGKDKPEAPLDPKEASAKADLAKARDFAKAHPEDLAGRLKEFTDIVWKHEGSDAAREAAAEVGAVKALILEKVGVWMADLNRQVQGLVDSKQYGAAVRKIEELKSAHDLPEWKLAAEKRASELYVLGKRLAEEEAAKNPPAPGAEEKPVVKALSEEAKGYPSRWEGAAARATARDYPGALAELERIAGSLKEPDIHSEAEADLALFRAAGAAFKESMDFLKQRTRGSGLSLGYRDAAGAPKRAAGAVLQIDADRVEIRSGKDSAFVDWTDVSAATLAEIAQRGKFDPRALTALCLLEGEVEAARVFRSEVAPRWWTYAEGARARIPKPDPAERSARDLFTSAEKAYRSMESRPAAVESYRALRTDYSSSFVVKAYSERIFRRGDGGREYCFTPADFSVEGTIRLAKSGKLESSQDSDIPDTIRNFAELEFAALAGQTYRCWLWVGACCEETFLFYIQGTEFTDVDPKTRKRISCDPGSSFAASVKHSIRGLKKTHDEHKVKGAKTHPKTAARWEWIEIPVPKYAVPGAKKLRFMTSQAGFSIASAVVSVTRKVAPPEAELKELEKARALDEPSLPVDPDLVGWWTFDDGAGSGAVDLSGKGHAGKLVSNVTWIDGKIGGAVRMAGARSYVEVADSELLRIPGDLTMSLWVRRTAESGDWVCVLGRGTRDQRNYGLWLEANNRKWMFQQYGSGNGSSVNVYGKSLIELNQWTHLATTIEQNTIRVYFNGVLDGEDRRGGAPPNHPAPLGIGLACEHSSLIGDMDDVRLYRRALGAGEIRSLFEMGR